METLQINKGNALTAYDKGGQTEKNLLENLFGKQTFSREITDRVKTFEDALTVLGINRKDWSGTVNCMQGDTKSIQAYAQLSIVARALNEGWTPDWSNGREYKWYPWHRYTAGSGFSFDGCDYGSTYTGVGSRLVFKSEALAKYAGTQFIDLYNQFLSL